MTPKQLAEEFRRLAAEAGEYADFVDAPDKIYEASAYLQYGLQLAYEQAAQMVEEKLNGDD